MLHRVLIFCAALAGAGCTVLPREPSAPAEASVETLWATDAVDALIALSAMAPAEGLGSYHRAASALTALQAHTNDSEDGAAAYDLAADALFLDLARTYSRGALDPALVDPDWRIPRPADPDISSSLLAARRDPTAVRTLTTLLPQSEEYAALRAELAGVSAEPYGALDTAGRTRETRIVSLRASMERWRWLPRALPTPRVEVRIAQFQAVLHQATVRPRVHTAIVGAQRTQTPSFAAEIRAVTLNPAWTPPRSILTNELLPLFARDPSAVSRGGYEAIDAAGAIVDPATIDWAARPFPYHVRQRPGPGNALGRVKFEMPNPYDIYLHDTPSRALFARENRALSHGCVRVENPLDLAAALLAPEFPAGSVEQEVDTGETRSLPLAAPLPVYAFYLTASSAEGVVLYAEDVYGRDAALIAALDAPASTVAPAGPASLVASLSECAIG